MDNEGDKRDLVTSSRNIIYVLTIHEITQKLYKNS